MMDSCFYEDTALLLMGAQRQFDHYSQGRRNNPDAERLMKRLLARWRDLGLPVVHVRQHQPSPDAFLRDFTPQTHELVIDSLHGCAFTNTGLHAYLQTQGVKKLVLVGFKTNGMIDVTARVAASHGFEVRVAHDATAAFDTQDYRGKWCVAEALHAVTLASLQADHIQVLSATDVLASVPDGAASYA